MTGYVDNNEGLICDAVVRFLEENTHHNRTDLTRPEIDGGLGGVDLLFRLGNDIYALEHTKIESFPNQITFNARFNQFIQPVIDEVRKLGLPKPGEYRLLLPVDTHVNAKGEQLEGLQTSLIQWICETAQKLHAIHPEHLSQDFGPRVYQDKRTGRLDGIPFDITLTRTVRWNYPDKLDGYLLPVRPVPVNLEEKRHNRVQTALNKKKKKLAERKLSRARTVLVLENNDFALTTSVEVRNCLAVLLPDHPFWLDELLYMDAATASWKLYRWNWDEANWHYTHNDFDPACLVDVCPN